MFLEYRKELRVIYNNLGALVTCCNMTEIIAVIYCDLGSESLYLCSLLALVLSEMTHQDFSKILIELVHYYIFREAKPRQNVYWSRLSVCLCVCLSVPRLIPTLLADLDVTWGMVGGAL